MIDLKDPQLYTGNLQMIKLITGETIIGEANITNDEDERLIIMMPLQVTIVDGQTIQLQSWLICAEDPRCELDWNDIVTMYEPDMNITELYVRSFLEWKSHNPGKVPKNRLDI